MRNCVQGFVIVASALLAGCGFQLRDDALLPSALQPIYIGGGAGNGALAQGVRYQLTNANTVVTPRAAEANYHLLLLNEDQERRIVSLDRRGLAAEYGITSKLHFELRDKRGQRVLGPETLTQRRTITNNPDNALTTSQDLEIVRTEMNQALATQVVRRLGAFAKHQMHAVEAATQEPADAAAAVPAATPSSPQPVN